MELRIFSYLVFWISMLLTHLTQVTGVKCPGKCISPEKCKEKEGSILAYCTNGKACCGEHRDVSGVCNQIKTNTKVAFFKSPNYPEPYEGNLVCRFQLNLDPSTEGVVIDFLDLLLPHRPGSMYFPMRRGGGGLVCDSDMFFIRGYSNWMPDARCGNLTGQSTVLELEENQKYISLLFVMSSSEYKWKIKLTQISAKDLENFGKCLNKKMEMWNKEIGVEYQYDYHPQNESMAMPNSTETNNKTDADPGKGTPLSLIDDDYTSESEEFIGPLPLVVNGQISVSEEIPWQVSIQGKQSDEVKALWDKVNSTKYLNCPYYKSGYKHVCGGSIIGERHILTASHCVTSRDPLTTVKQSDSIRIHVGDFDFCSLNETALFQIHEVEKITFHYNYIVPMISNDVAVITLKTKIKFGKSVRPISLANEKLEDMEYDNETNLLLSGWGNTRKVNLLDPNLKPSYPTKMRKTTKLTVQDLEECNEAKYFQYGNIDNGTEEEVLKLLSNKYSGSFSKWICTSSRKDGTPSFGDSGGPLVGMDQEWKNPYLIGVVSHLETHSGYVLNETSKIIRRKSVNFYAKVTSYLDWIYMAIGGEC